MGEPNTVYHEIKIPLLDIYQDGENEAFIKLQRKIEGEKNLVIFPSEFRHNLVPDHESRRFSRLRSVPGTMALEYLSGLPVIDHESYAVFQVCPGLDIAYMKQSGFLGTDGLNKRVIELFGKPPIVMTTSEDEFLNYKAAGIQVEKPRDFILAEAEIVTRGRIQGTDELCAKLFESPDNSLEFDVARELMKKPGDSEPPTLFFNQFIEFMGSKGTTYAKVIPDRENPRVEIVNIPKNRVYRINNHTFNSTACISARSNEQYLAVQHALIDPKINLVFLCGSYGSGKTILAYSSGLDQILIYDEKIQKKRGLPYAKDRRGAFRQIAIFRPNDPIGGKKRDPGTLPGDLWDKTEHQFGSFMSAHETLQRTGVNFPFEDLLRHPNREGHMGQKRQAGLKIGEGSLPQDCEAIRIYSFADIQGCNFEDLYVIIDEAENFTHDEMKALFSRGCPSSKYVVLGDPFQVVNPECTKDRNGLTSAVRHYLPFEDVVLFNLTINNRGPISRRAESWIT